MAEESSDHRSNEELDLTVFPDAIQQLVSSYDTHARYEHRGRTVNAIIADLEEERKLARKALQGIAEYNRDQQARSQRQSTELREVHRVLNLAGRNRTDHERALEQDLTLSELLMKRLLDNTAAE